MKYDIPRLRIELPKLNKKIILKAIEEVNFVTGLEINEFENKLAKKFNKRYCITTINGFSAILLSIIASGIINKKILTPALSTCFSIINAIKASGNQPVFCDIDINTGNILIDSAKEVYSKEGFSMVISPNHFGIPSNISKLKEFNVPIIEDAAQSFFSNTYFKSESDFLVLSFYPTKLINAIDGGAILTNKEEYYLRIKNIVSYHTQYINDGITRYNFGIPNIHACMGLQSLAYSDNIEKRLQKIVSRYIKIFNNLKSGVSYLGRNEKKRFLFKQFILKFENKKHALDFMKFMDIKKIQTSYELLKLYNNGVFENSEELVSSHCSLPLYPSLTDKEVDYIERSLYEAHEKGIL